MVCLDAMKQVATSHVLRDPQDAVEDEELSSHFTLQEEKRETFKLVYIMRQEVIYIACNFQTIEKKSC